MYFRGPSVDQTTADLCNFKLGGGHDLLNCVFRRMLLRTKNNLRNTTNY